MRRRRFAALAAAAVLVAYGCGDLVNGGDDSSSSTPTPEAGSATDTGSSTNPTEDAAGGDAGCQPKTCAELGANCGSVPDQCGAEIPDCGTCTGATPNCGGNGPNKCGASPCDAATSCPSGTCGTISNGCGGTLGCPGCGSGKYCDNNSGKCQNVCVSSGACSSPPPGVDCKGASGTLTTCSAIPQQGDLPPGTCTACTKMVSVFPPGYFFCCP